MDNIYIKSIQAVQKVMINDKHCFELYPFLPSRLWMNKGDTFVSTFLALRSSLHKQTNKQTSEIKPGLFTVDELTVYLKIY